MKQIKRFLCNVLLLSGIYILLLATLIGLMFIVSIMSTIIPPWIFIIILPVIIMIITFKIIKEDL